MKKFGFVWLVVLVLVSCKDEEESSQSVTPASSSVRSSVNDLPTCNASSTGWLAYVTDNSSFYNCDGSNWSTVSIQGPTGATGATGAAGATGPTGATGSAGEDGSIRIYGNGSAGALTVSSSTSWASSPPSNLQFSSVTIDSGVTLTVPSGTVIRCSGTFTNSGTISISSGAVGPKYNLTSSDALSASQAPAAGISLVGASNGEYGDNSAVRQGGEGGTGLSALQARLVRYPGPLAGGAGGAAPKVNTINGIGSNGGGSLVVIARTSITNSGTITAPVSVAAQGAGGGGGGVVILASAGSVTNSGTITANGGDGGSGAAAYGAGGGGGGGLVHMLAPSITQGTVNVSGGSAGSFTASSASPRGGGGGGGASAGNGGDGTDVNTDNLAATAAADGSSGQSLQSAVDPTSLF